MDQIENDIDEYFEQKNRRNYWISFDIDGVDAGEFVATGTAEDQGLSLEFIEKFFERMTRRSVGMDFTEVNFELSPNHESRITDEQTFRYLFEMICHQVNEPVSEDQYYQVARHVERQSMGNPYDLIHLNSQSNHNSRGFSTKNSKK